MYQFVSHAAESCISQIQKLLPTDASQNLLSPLSSCIDNCNSLLDSTIFILKHIENHAFSSFSVKDITPLLSLLHCTGQQFQYNYAFNIKSTSCCKCLNASAPTCLSSPIHIYTPPHSLYFSSDPLCIPQTRLHTFGPHTGHLNLEWITNCHSIFARNLLSFSSNILKLTFFSSDSVDVCIGMHVYVFLISCRLWIAVAIISNL